MMKKLTAMVLALMLALGVGLACGEASSSLNVPRMGVMADPAIDRLSAELYPAALTGTGYVDELSLDIHWPESADAFMAYYLILEPVSDDGNAAEYHMIGDIVHGTLGENGEIKEETWENRQLRGTAAFAVNREGITELSFHDEVNPDLNDVKLRVIEAPAPAAEDVAANVLRPVFELEEDTVGSRMKQAATAADLIAWASSNGLFSVRQEELSAAVKEAAASLQLTEEEFASLKAKAARVAETVREAAGLTVEDPEEHEAILREMEDAGAAEVLRKALTGSVEVCSAGVLADQLEALEYTAK